VLTYLDIDAWRLDLELGNHAQKRQQELPFFEIIIHYQRYKKARR
jgi:hypothetical protein